MSVRQSIIDDVVRTMRAVTRSASDETPDVGDYPKRVDHTWVFEGEESAALETQGLTTAHLTVVTQSTFTLTSLAELHKRGRALLAEVQREMMRDYQRGGSALLTTEQGSVIGSVPGEAQRTVGVLTTWWDVQYDRNWRDPSRKD